MSRLQPLKLLSAAALAASLSTSAFGQVTAYLFPAEATGLPPVESFPEVNPAADFALETAPGPGSLAPPAMRQPVWMSISDQSAENGDLPAPESLPRISPARQPRSEGQDQALIARGRTAFQQSCTQCHEAERALERRKSFSDWLATVRRMAQMDGADIPSGDHRPIAAYLASLNGPPPAERPDDPDTPETNGESLLDLSDDVLGSGLSFSGTISTLWRGGNDNLENPGFFPDVWLRADWQPAGPLRGRATTCTSCHSDAIGDSGFTFELVEAFAHYDLLHWLREHKKHSRAADHGRQELQVGLAAGRFVVPFGAFSERVHPGIYRTVTPPMMFIMGRQVMPEQPRPPVLPMPYSDEGVNLDAQIPLFGDLNATMNVYAVNGLRGFGPGMQFTPSRAYTDHNGEPAVGGRVTAGSRSLRLGGSVMSGRMQDEGAAPLNYHFAGADASLRYEDLLRFYFEYAMRRNDANVPRGQVVYGTVYQLEVLLLSKHNVNLLLQYDNLEHRDFFGERSMERFTWGINTVLPGGSLLIFNHERWNPPNPLPEVDVVGFRWVATF